MDIIHEMCAASQRHFHILGGNFETPKNSYLLTLAVFCATRTLQPFSISLFVAFQSPEVDIGQLTALQPREPYFT